MELSSRLAHLGFGLKRKDLALKEWSPSWQEGFLCLESKIKSLFKVADAIKIEHFGSTSVQGMLAKPILDILLSYPLITSTKDLIAILESLSFVYRGDSVAKLFGEEADPGRHFFVLYDKNLEIAYCHLHVFVEGHPDISKNLRFRNVLRSSKEAFNDYIDLKKSLSDKKFSRSEYRENKSDFITKHSF